MDCSAGDYQEKLMAYWDGELTQEENYKIQSHLQSCSACQAKLEEWQSLSSLLHQYKRMKKPPFSLRERIQKELREREIKKEETSPFSHSLGYTKQMIHIFSAIAATLLLVLGIGYWFSPYQTRNLAKIQRDTERHISKGFSSPSSVSKNITPLSPEEKRSVPLQGKAPSPANHILSSKGKKKSGAVMMTKKTSPQSAIGEKEGILSSGSLKNEEKRAKNRWNQEEIGKKKDGKAAKGRMQIQPQFPERSQKRKKGKIHKKNTAKNQNHRPAKALFELAKREGVSGLAKESPKILERALKKEKRKKQKSEVSSYGARDLGSSADLGKPLKRHHLLLLSQNINLAKKKILSIIHTDFSQEIEIRRLRYGQNEEEILQAWNIGDKSKFSSSLSHPCLIMEVRIPLRSLSAFLHKLQSQQEKFRLFPGYQLKGKKIEKSFGIAKKVQKDATPLAKPNLNRKSSLKAQKFLPPRKLTKKISLYLCIYQGN